MSITDDIAEMHADWARTVTWVQRSPTGTDAVTKEPTGWDETEVELQAVVVEPKEELEAMTHGGIERYDFELRILPPTEIGDEDLVVFDGKSYRTKGHREAHDADNAVVERVYRLAEVVG
jgi:hypothetical protein